MLKLILSLYDTFMIKRAKMQADRLHSATGRRYYVIRMGNKPIVVDRHFVNLYNSAHPKSKITIERLLVMSLYYTK